MWRFVIVALIFGGAQETAASTIPVGSLVGLNAFAVAGGSATGDSDAVSQSAGTNPLVANVNATAKDGSNVSTASGSIAAAWLSPDSGSVHFDLSLSIALPTQGGGVALYGSDGWTYTFETDATGAFVADFDATAVGFLSAAIGVTFDFDGTQTNIPPIGAGFIVAPISSAGIHTARLGWFPGNIGAPGFGTRDAGVFLSLESITDVNWRIEAIPENSTYILIATGLLGLVGGRWLTSERSLQKGASVSSPGRDAARRA